MVPPGYDLVGNVDLDPASPNLGACEPESVGLYNIIVSDPDGVALADCGGFDNPCPVRREREWSEKTVQGSTLVIFGVINRTTALLPL